MLEAEDLAALGVGHEHHMPDGAIFSGRIHRLEINRTAWRLDA
jgi:hypothetical protein